MSLQKGHKKAVLKGGTTKLPQLHQPPSDSGDAALRHILSEVGREAQPHWGYSCVSWSRTDFSVMSFMLTLADNDNFSYECLKLFHREVTESKSADKWKGDKNL